MLSHCLTIFLCLFFCVAHADEPQENGMRVLPAGTVHKGDYFAWGDIVEISGVVDGDAYILATQAVIDGKINGDLLIVGGNVEISGTVTHNIRALAGQITTLGSVGNNATLVGGNVQLTPSANIKGNLVIAAGNAEVSSNVGSDLTAAVSTLRLSSHIGGNVDGYMGQLRITSRAVIDGDIDYRSSTIARIDPGAVIKRNVTHHPTLVHSLMQKKWIQSLMLGSKIATVLMNFLYTFAIGFVLIHWYPKKLAKVLSELTHNPWKAFGVGIVILVLLPLCSLLLLMTVLGVPFALTLIAINIFTFYTAKVFSVIWSSNWLFTKMGMKKPLAMLALGLVGYFLLISIPFFGTALSLASMVFGMGAGVLSQTKSI